MSITVYNEYTHSYNFHLDGFIKSPSMGKKLQMQIGHFHPQHSMVTPPSGEETKVVRSCTTTNLLLFNGIKFFSKLNGLVAISRP